MDAARTTVLYLIGTTRCGSTLTGSLLGLVPGVVHIGEVARVWEEGFLLNFRCGCGAPFQECGFWSDVFARAFGGKEHIDPNAMIETVGRFARTRHAPRLATASGRAHMRAGMAPYADAMARLYRGVAEVARARVVMDSSKTPLLAWVLSEREDIDLRLLHVTRDPRAVVYSWQRKKFDPAKGEDMHREGTLKTSLAWLAWNGLAASMWDRSAAATPYLHVRYEDLTADPHRVLDSILDWLGEETRAIDLVSEDRRFTGAPAHTIAGNPMRFDRGAKKIAADTGWQTGASRWDKLLVAGLTWPLLGKYRYPLRSR